MLDTKTMNIRYAGIIMFFVGAVVAISSAAKMPTEGNDFPTTVGVFSFSLLIGIFGNILWHRTERKKVLAELELHKNDESLNPILLLRQTIPAIEDLNAKVDQYHGMDLCDKVDEILDQFVHPFTERRKTFQDILGLAAGSEILLTIAYAERMLNRVWSAASDGYPEEAKICLVDSLSNYKIALKKTEAEL